LAHAQPVIRQPFAAFCRANPAAELSAQSELPVEQRTKVGLCINLKTAKALGLNALLAQSGHP